MEWYHHFTHIACMCKRVERVTAKTRRTSCTNWTISFGVSRFRTRTHLLHVHFNVFQTFLNSSLFLHSVRIIQSDVINFQQVLTSFAVFQSFTDLFRELNDGEIENHYEMNSENVGTWHGIIISPAEHLQKSTEGHGENWTHLVYKLDNLFRSIRVSDENSSVTRALQRFLNLFELRPILRLVCIIQRDVINFQHVLTSFAVFQSFIDLFRAK